MISSVFSNVCLEQDQRWLKVVNSLIRLTSHDITNSLIVIVNHYKPELFMAAFNCEIMY